MRKYLFQTPRRIHSHCFARYTPNNKLSFCTAKKGSASEVELSASTLEKYYDANGTKYPKIKGFATSEGTKLYSERNPKVVKEHFRTSAHGHLRLSSIGIGSYIGAPDEADDLKLLNATANSVLSGGVNIIDTAINYRFQKSERAIGAALRYLQESHKIQRDELFLCTKSGYVPEDADKGQPGRIILDDLINSGKLSKGDVAADVHCMHPAWLEDQLERSLTNLGVETIDLLYLHNAAESQLPLIGSDQFYKRLAEAFEFCEEMIEIGKIRSYGLATWVCFRSPPTEEKIHVSLQKVVETAIQVAGDKHGFKYIQVPVNLLMTESYTEKWQEIDVLTQAQTPSANLQPAPLPSMTMYTVVDQIRARVHEFDDSC